MARPAPSRTPATSTRGFFAGLSKVVASSARSPFISRPGTTLYRVLSIRAGENRVKQPYFHMDLEAIHLLLPGTLPEEIRKMNTAAERSGNPSKVDAGGHGKGERVSWRVKVHGEWEAIHLANIKNAAETILEILGVDGFEDYDDEKWDEAIFGDDGMAGEDQPAAGLLVVGTTDARISKKGEIFTTTAWTPGEDVALDLIEKGVLTRAACGFEGDPEIAA